MRARGCTLVGDTAEAPALVFAPAKSRGRFGAALWNYHLGMLNDRLKKLRLSRGLTLQQVGEHFGISVASVANWENGKSKPDSRKLSRLAELLGCSVSYLLEGDNYHPPRDEDQAFPGVPFRDWFGLCSSAHASKEHIRVSPLHTRLSEAGFATRYPGSSGLNWAQGPVPAGALIFVDPEKKLKTDYTVLIQSADGYPCFAKVQMPAKPSGYYLSPINSPDTPTKTSDAIVIGCVVEWRISGTIT